MTIDEAIDAAKSLGYAIDLITDSYSGENDEGGVLSSPAIYRIEGFGISTMMMGDDIDSWTRLLDQKAHDARALQANNPDATDADILQANLDAAVSLGDLTQKEADQIKADAATALSAPSEAYANLEKAVEAVVSAPDFETAKANLQKLIVR